jgi:hypothetical protein
VRHWLGRELAGAPDAERALAGVYACWPGPAAPPGLAGAVLRAAGLAGSGAAWQASRALGWAFAAGLLVAVPAASHLVGLLLELGRSGQLPALAADALVASGQAAAAAGAALWAWADAGRSLAAALRGPGALGLCTAAALAALVAFWRLVGVLAMERSGRHA